MTEHVLEPVERALSDASNALTSIDEGGLSKEFAFRLLDIDSAIDKALRLVQKAIDRDLHYSTTD